MPIENIHSLKSNMYSPLKIIFVFLVLIFPFSRALAQDADETNSVNPATKAIYKTADKNLDDGDFDAAIVGYTKIIALAPLDRYAYNGRGNAFLEKGDYDRAIADFDKNIELKPDDFYAYYARGRAYFKKGDYAKSIADHIKELELEPLRSLGQLERGNALFMTGHSNEAIQDYNRTIAFSDLTAGFYARGLAYLARSKTLSGKDDKAAAIGDMRYYIERVPDDEEARRLLIAAGVNVTELPAPLITESFSEANKKLMLAVFRRISRAEYNEAVWSLTKIIKDNPKSAVAYFYRGYVLEMQASELNYAKINGDYTKAVEIDPKFAAAYLRRGRLAFFNNGEVRGRADIARALALNPSSAEALYYTGLYSKGRTGWTVKSGFFNQAVKINPNFADVYLSRAEGFEVRKEYDKAAADYSSVIKINPNDPRAFEGRARIYCEMEKKELATADEKRFVELGGNIDSPCAEN
jgi:tetratricopeptide (TPR) repeat protein